MPLADRLKRFLVLARAHNPLYYLPARLRARADFAFDRRHGLDTCEPVPLSELAIGPRSAPSAIHYQPTSISDFHRILRFSHVRPSEFTFIDLGSGKGRVLMLAERAGFPHVIGVEADPRLCQIAQANIRLWHQQRGKCGLLDIVNIDARDFEFPPGNLLVYLFNPFEGKVFEEVAERLAAAARAPSREIVVIYNRNRLGERIEATGVFKGEHLRPRLPWRQATIAVYRRAP